MRVLLVNSFHYRRGGDCVHYLDLADAFRKQGHTVACFAMSHPENERSPWDWAWPPNVEYRGTLSLAARTGAAGRSVYSRQTQRAIRGVIESFRPDIVHFHSIHHHLTTSVVDEAAKHPAKLVWTLHDYRTVCPATLLLRDSQVCEKCALGGFWHCAALRCRSGELSRSTAAAVESYLTRRRGTLAKVDAYIAPSRFLARKVLAMGLPARRIVVVPNPLSSLAVVPRDPHPRGLLYVGRLSVEKGVDVLIRSLHSVRASELTIVGDGPAEPRLRALATECGVAVDFRGWVPASEVGVHMAKAALLCAPSVCYENCPNVVLDAMRSGLPVIASDIGGLSELLDSGRAGWLVPPGSAEAWGSAISEALVSPERLSSLAEAAKLRATTRHSREAFTLAINSIYEDLAG